MIRLLIFVVRGPAPLVWLALLALPALARPVAAQINNCIPPTGRGAPIGSLDEMRGSTLVVAYSTSGPKQGRITSGTVDLTLAPPMHRAAGVLMIGSSSLELDRIGAQFAGSVRSRDPGAPGVTLDRGAPGAAGTLTFGSVRTRDANGALSVPVTRFEFVERFTKGFRGRWRTIGGTGEGANAAGYFCASRF